MRHPPLTVYLMLWSVICCCLVLWLIKFVIKILPVITEQCYVIMSFIRSLQSELQDAEKDELDSSSGCDMSFELSSENLNSPPRHPGPRKLDFTEGQTPVPSKLTFSPPYKRVCNQFCSNVCVWWQGESNMCKITKKITLHAFCGIIDVVFL